MAIESIVQKWLEQVDDDISTAEALFRAEH